MWIDSNGDPLRAIEHVHHVSNDVNSVTGFTLHEHNHITVVTNFVAGTVTLSGAINIMQRPGVSEVIHIVGPRRRRRFSFRVVATLACRRKAQIARVLDVVGIFSPGLMGVRADTRGVSSPPDVHLESTSPHQGGVTRNGPHVAIVAIALICREIVAGSLRPCPAVAPRSTTENRGVASSILALAISWLLCRGKGA